MANAQATQLSFPDLDRPSYNKSTLLTFETAPISTLWGNFPEQLSAISLLLLFAGVYFSFQSESIDLSYPALPLVTIF